MEALSDYIHSLGLKFGLYSDAGNFTCGGRPGSLFHEEKDAQTYADWGVDYLKVSLFDIREVKRTSQGSLTSATDCQYDNCYNENLPYPERYTLMRDALNKTGRPIFYSICEWGVYSPWDWGGEIGNSWRTTDDIKDDWNHLIRVADNSMYIGQHAGPGGWNDLDMLEIGNGMCL